MPKEVTIRDLCDPCFKAGERTDATLFTGLLDGMRKPRSLLLCEVHHKEFVEPLRELLTKMGTTVDVEEPATKPAAELASPTSPPTSAPKKTSRPKAGVKVARTSQVLECPVEGCHHEGVKSSVQKHSQLEHGLSIAQVAFQNGFTLEGKEIRFVCRDQDCRQHPSGFAVGAAVTQHLMRAHGHKGSLDTSRYAA